MYSENGFKCAIHDYTTYIGILLRFDLYMPSLLSFHLVEVIPGGGGGDLTNPCPEVCVKDSETDPF